jgi:hypothetical protein
MSRPEVRKPTQEYLSRQSIMADSSESERAAVDQKKLSAGACDPPDGPDRRCDDPLGTVAVDAEGAVRARTDRQRVGDLDAFRDSIPLEAAAYLAKDADEHRRSAGVYSDNDRATRSRELRRRNDSWHVVLRPRGVCTGLADARHARKRPALDGEQKLATTIATPGFADRDVIGPSVSVDVGMARATSAENRRPRKRVGTVAGRAFGGGTGGRTRR